MQVTNLIKDALVLLGRADVCERVDDQQKSEETAFIVKTLLYCLNAVLCELARFYFPLTSIDNITPSNGKIPLSSLGKTPVRITAVKQGAIDVKYTVFPTYIAVNVTGEVQVEYDYSPARVGLDDTVDVDYMSVCEDTILYGVASEYCQINALLESADNWENRYRAAIENAIKTKKTISSGEHHAPSSPTGLMPRRSWL